MMNRLEYGNVVTPPPQQAINTYSVRFLIFSTYEYKTPRNSMSNGIPGGLFCFSFIPEEHPGRMSRINKFLEVIL